MKKTQFLLFALWLGLCSSAFAHKIVFTSLPNPNVYPIFVIIDQDYLAADFIPARGGVSALLSLMKSGKADITYLNEKPARNMARSNNWTLLGPTISKAVHLLSYGKINDRDDIEALDIISAFPGGSPNMIFKSAHFSVQPKFIDPYLAIQLFLKKDYNALLLPEPYISEVANLLIERGESYDITDIQQYVQSQEVVGINAGVVREGYDLKKIRQAFTRAAAFIDQHPQQASEIIAAGFSTHFNKKVPLAAIREALSSGRLQFGMEQNH